jgi:predicted aminopeptidase
MGGCQTTAYLGQAAVGQARLLAAREPLDRVIADTSRPQPLRERLALVRELRAFAQRELAMPEVQGFDSYVSTGRRSVVWNVVAAPAFSVEPLRWCFPVAGCVSYRGYFSRAAAQRFAHALARRGIDT